MRSTLRRILTLWRPHRLLGLALAGLLMLRAAFTVVLALSIKTIIDRVVEGDTSSAAGIVAVLVAGYVVSAGAALAAGYVEAVAGARILADVRASVFDHLQRLSVGFFARARVGDILARFSTDVAGMQQGAVRKPRQALQSLLSIVIFVPVMLALEWRLALVAILASPLAVIIGNRLTPSADEALDNEKRLLAGVLDDVGENLQAQPVIRAFGLSRRVAAGFHDRLDALQTGSVAANFRVLIISTVAQFSVTFVQLGVVGLGAIMAFNGELSAGDFAAFTALLAEFSWETTVIASDVLPEIQKAGSGIRRVDALLAEGPVVETQSEGIAPPEIATEVRFEDVGFAYGPGERQLDGVSLSIPAGSNVAVVGASGSGKSTLLNLLLRFYDPDEGAVWIDSLDLQSVDVDAYRERIGVVFQDTFLFSATIKENVLVARPSASVTQLVEAMRTAGLDDVLDSWPDGIETLLGPEGRRLSAGQRQRIGLARAILRSPRLLLLDEVTSALDPVTEAAVNETIAKLALGRTVIHVTHRLQSVAHSDQIIVFQQGKPVEWGSFADLQASGGLFAAMLDKQSGFAISPDGRGGEITPDRLRAIPLFAEIDEHLVSDLAGQFVADHFVAGENIFQEGDPADRFHVIARGVAEVIRGEGEGETVIAHLEDGDFFGEMALLHTAPRNATVRAVTPTLTLSLDRREFDALLHSSPEAANLVRRIAAERAGENAPVLH